MAQSLQEWLQSCLSEVIEEFAGPANTEELLGYLSDILPLKEQEYDVKHIQGTRNRYKASVDSCLSTYEEIENFIKAYQKRSNETLRKVTPKFLSEKNLYSVSYSYRCHHKTQYEPTMDAEKVRSSKPSKRMKNTNCPYSLCIRIKQDYYEEPFKSRIDIEWNHNHTVEAAHALTFKDISNESKKKITAMFDNGYTPALACREFLKGVRRKFVDDLEMRILLIGQWFQVEETLTICIQSIKSPDTAQRI